MDSFQRLKIEDLQEMCYERAEESLRLEFKSCNELRPGTVFRDKAGNQVTRTRDHVLDELTKDVTGLLNATGGTIIYGIRERNSRARELDSENIFNQGEISSERVVNWLRAHIQPPPSVNVYRVFADPADPMSSFYLVLEIPQGQQAFMAKNHRFYRRVGNTVQPMEQYEVVDVMNRSRAASLALHISLAGQPQFSDQHLWGKLALDVKITSTNYIASEYGAVKLSFAFPLKLANSTQVIFRGSQFNESTGLFLAGYEDTPPYAQSLKISWGASTGTVIFPDDWYDFNGNRISLTVFNPSMLPPPATYLIQIELFTMNASSKKFLFSIQDQGQDDFRILNVDGANYDEIMASFWPTYHTALKEIGKLDGKSDVF